MYLSRLMLEPRLRQTRRLVASPYEMHRAIARAFPDDVDGGAGRVLFRVDEDRRSGRLWLIVQSEKAPDWARAKLLADCLAGLAECKAISPVFRQGQFVYFRLRANPTVKRDGKRLGLLREQEQLAWLQRKAGGNGFSVVSCTVIPEGLCKDGKTAADAGRTPLTWLSARFEGVLRVEEPPALQLAISNGIGSGKGMGFGLLSVAPVKG